ncbi:SRPBCC family protein [Rugosimonospora africana]|uniref:Polyketide cyclase / dehydrase and lipid transport n=1 Tax=Rugosimonospora africana TaxID=556532 RepID=A0A8J3VTS8_9ACTN|nr:SRPBCC family protein [Rugosimonospora africana]GIH18490.1 hypothetical protein Raf01_66620 [Rugosimonospora africana]
MRQALRLPSEIPIEARVTIQRPVADVFAFYRDFENLPRFLGDVMAIERVGPESYRWTIAGPLGIRLKSTIKVTEERVNELIRYETTTVPGMRAEWTVRFAAEADPGRTDPGRTGAGRTDPGRTAAGPTEVHETLKTPFGRLGHVALILVGKPPAAEVAANLRRLKQLMETGRVTDTDHAVAGKFDGTPRGADRSGR